MHVALRPATLHENNHIACYFDYSRGSQSSIFSLLLLWRGALHANEILMPTFRGDVALEELSPVPHQVGVFYEIDIFDGVGSGASKIAAAAAPPAAAKCQNERGCCPMGRYGGNGQMVRLVEGNPLPDLGACKHFKKSLRWLRFSCCGKVYLCFCA